MDQPIETSRRFVNTWECDENAHLNVQFYYWHFEDAHVHFWYEAGWPASRNLPSIRHHHVRFHAELHVGDLMLIRSHLARTETGFALCHLMFNAETDDLAATCWCPLDDDDGLPALVPGAPVMDPPEAAQPRSLGPGVIPLVNRAAAAEAGYIETFRTLLKSSDCNAGGAATTKSLIAFQSDAAGHLWTHIGLDKDWLEANHFGRVAIESRISILSDIRPGTPLLIVTGLVGFATKTITFRHHTYDISAKSQVAVSEITGLAIDLDARRATSWPDELRKKLRSGLVKDGGN